MARRLVAVVAGLIAVMAISGIAWAAIPDSSGVIHGCYRISNPAKGAVTVIDTDAGEMCPSGTVALDWNQTGPQGPAGPQGASGPAGTDGVSGYTNVAASGGPVQPGLSATFQAPCPSGKIILGGGYSQSGNLIIYASQPYGPNTGWRVIAYNPTSDYGQITDVFAICAVMAS